MTKHIEQVVVQMYRMGTGDCFVVKFMSGDDVSFKMLIDCGCWSGGTAKLTPFIQTLKGEVDSEVDVLVVTHEHKDHVLGFDTCKAEFSDGQFNAKQVWMAWTERDGDAKVKRWKREYGQKKMALMALADRMDSVVSSEEFLKQFTGSHGGAAMAIRKQGFAAGLREFADLHATKGYAGDLAGMRFVKEAFADSVFSYYEPGDVIEDIPGLDGVRVYVLGPPTKYNQVAVESGPEGEAYEHNKDLVDSDAFAAAALNTATHDTLLPFDRAYVSTVPDQRETYDDPGSAWRRVDFDWLFSGGAYALRMNSLTNNLSLVLAIEFIESGKVILFPGDAEYGSWKSWHEIDWSDSVPGLTTEKLLNRTVFYKVAHHLSHNGTAKSIGLDMMTSSNLQAMATLDYDVISNGWKSTMPNVGIIRDLLEKTKGRTLIMNTDGLLFDRVRGTTIDQKLPQYQKKMSAQEKKAFNANHRIEDHFIELKIDVGS